MTDPNTRVSITEAYNDQCVIQQIERLKDEKQDKLTAGTNITIDSNNVISSADAKAQWGQITGSIGSQTDLQTALAAKADTSALAAKQNVLTAGQNITIVNDVISATGELSVAWGNISGSISDQSDLQTALNAKADSSALTAHTSNVSNPHSVTKAQVGLGNVDNTSDASKPISTATQTALDAKASASDLTTLQGRVTTAESNITANAAAIASEASTRATEDAKLVTLTTAQNISGIKKLTSGEFDMSSKRSESDFMSFIVSGSSGTNAVVNINLKNANVSGSNDTCSLQLIKNDDGSTYLILSDSGGHSQVIANLSA